MRHPLHMSADDASHEADVVCPFCKEGDFDLTGLAYHLDVYCEEMDAARKRVREGK